MLRNRPIYGLKFEGKRYDAGDKLGFLKATVEFALQPSRSWVQPFTRVSENIVRTVVRDSGSAASVGCVCSSCGLARNPCRRRTTGSRHAEGGCLCASWLFRMAISDSGAGDGGQYRRLNGDTPEALNALCWVARGELAGGTIRRKPRRTQKRSSADFADMLWHPKAGCRAASAASLGRGL